MVECYIVWWLNNQLWKSSFLYDYFKFIMEESKFVQEQMKEMNSSSFEKAVLNKSFIY